MYDWYFSPVGKCILKKCNRAFLVHISMYTLKQVILRQANLMGEANCDKYQTSLGKLWMDFGLPSIIPSVLPFLELKAIRNFFKK